MEERAFSKLQDGLLVLADISGYTTFVTQTEIDHSWEILHELLEVMVRSAEGKMDVSQVEGDAILSSAACLTKRSSRPWKRPSSASTAEGGTWWR